MGMPVSMFNPRFIEVTRMVDTIAKVHAGELDEMELAYTELKDPEGNVYQIVPYLRVLYKG